MECQKFRYLHLIFVVWVAFASWTLLVENAGGVAHESAHVEKVKRRCSYDENDHGNQLCKEKMDICIVVDGSGTICRGRKWCPSWKFLLQFIHELASNWKIGPHDTKVALVTFSDVAKVEWNLNGHKTKKALLSSIDKVKYPGHELTERGRVKGTVTEVFTRAAGERPNVRNVSILITDGAPNIELKDAEDGSNELQKNGIEVFVVGVTKECSEDFARNLSSTPRKKNKTYFIADDYFSIHCVMDKLKKQICRDDE